MDETTVPYRPVPQSRPPIVEGGDCGALVLAGLCGLEAEEIYKDYQKSENPTGFTRDGFERTLQKLKRDDQLDRVVKNMPLWLPRKPNIALNWGQPADHMDDQWWKYLRVGIDGGYAGLVMVRLRGDGRVAPSGRYTMPDHWAMISGTRHLDRKDEDGDTRSVTERRQILMCCSSTRTPDTQWVSAKSFLGNYGGFNVILARPTDA